MIYKNILLETKNRIGYITINRPKQLNALNLETIQELHEAIVCSEKNNLVRSIIITGSGTKSFVAGADIKEFSSFTVSEGENLSRTGQESLFDLLENCSKPIIAAINGFALGGGLELAMACHIRIASKNAKMGLPEASLGVIPGYGGTQRLPQLVGKAKAFEMILTTAMINADEALKYGLVNQVCAQTDLKQACEAICYKINKNSSSAISSAIKSINAGLVSGTNGFEVEKKQFGECFGTKDFTEGTRAFLEKRKPNFS